MAERRCDPVPTVDPNGIPGLGDLPAASSLMSSCWSRDNLVTSLPSRLYNGAVLERVGAESLEYLLQDLEKNVGPIRVGAARMGALTWDISYATEEGAFVLQVPLALDEPGRRGRAKREVPRLNIENLRYFAERGLTRFIVEPRDFMVLAGHVPAASFAALPDHHPIMFGQGNVQLEVSDGKLSWLVALGPRPTADLLAEMVAALVYHYEADTDGGTAVTDVCVNDGDFTVKRRLDGTYAVRLTAARRREGGIGTSLLLLYLVQLIAYEDWSVNGNLTELPTPISNPSVAFEGLVRGLRYRYRDLGLSEDDGLRQALRWIRDFARSREGRAYRPWVERFLTGQLPLSFGDELRERWWQLNSLQTKLGVLELRARQQILTPNGQQTAASAARALQTLLDRLSRQIGRYPEDDGTALRINELGRDDLVSLLDEAQVPAATHASVADELLTNWPYRSLEHLMEQVPSARGLRKLKGRLSFGRVVPDAEQGTLKSLASTATEAEPPRPFANAEIFGGLALSPTLHAAALATFPTFEAYMDAALFDESWGYYPHHVVIGEGGHFGTHPEEFSPRYGAWLADWAFRLWGNMIAHGELTDGDTFPIIEFGAGNGRLARDILDAVTHQAGDSKAPQRARWQTFAACVQYRVYEKSPALRDKQRLLLGLNAVVMDGDARRPHATLQRDFPEGVKGLVLTNEVPDVFGVHKVLLTAEGRAFAALVVPRVEPTLRRALGDELARRIDAVDREVRNSFDLRANEGDFYLDAETFGEVMVTVAGVPAARREGLLGALWFEEAYVPAALFPELGTLLRNNAAQYATALAADDAGVVLYVNVHADRFIRELAMSLTAGFIVTIDYGDTTWDLIQRARRGEFPFRVYGEWRDYIPRPNDPYAAPGTQDLTADVNFTDLAQAGLETGLHVLHFGPERDVTGEQLGELLHTAVERESIADFLGNPVFKVLVLGTRPSDVFSGPLLSPLPLSRGEQDVVKSRRPKIPAIQQTLSAFVTPTEPA